MYYGKKAVSKNVEAAFFCFGVSSVYWHIINSR